MKFGILWGFFGLLTGQNTENNLEYAEYDLSVYIKNRYVVSTIEVSVENTGSDASEYKFAVDLEKNEFISSLEMEVGNKTRIGEVKEKEEANKIFERAKQQGKSTAKISKEDRLVWKIEFKLTLHNVIYIVGWMTVYVSSRFKWIKQFSNADFNSSLYHGKCSTQIRVSASEKSQWV